MDANLYVLPAGFGHSGPQARARKDYEVEETIERTVGVVIPTHNRPELLEEAIQAVLAQDYAGPIEIVVVYDGAPVDHAIARGGARPVRVIENSRTPGLSGARNSGILELRTDLVAFCDDDDYWIPEKLRLQVDAFDDGYSMASCAIGVEFGNKLTVRTAGMSSVSRADLLRSRMSMLHSSTFLFRRSDLMGELGLVAEDAPGSQNEDWDILLRAAALAPIRHIDEPNTRVRWGPASFFSRRWDSRNDSLRWMLARHPDIQADRVGYSRVLGQLAFGSASLGRRKDAWRDAVRALRINPAQWRAIVAAGVAVVPRSSEPILRLLNRFGRGV